MLSRSCSRGLNSTTYLQEEAGSPRRPLLPGSGAQAGVGETVLGARGASPVHLACLADLGEESSWITVRSGRASWFKRVSSWD